MKIEKICPKCEVKFTIEKGGYSKTFCSRSCANSRKHTTETKNKISDSYKSYLDKLSEKDKLERIQKFSKPSRQALKEKSLHRILTTPTEELGYDSRKRKVFLEQDKKCNKCKIHNWQGKELTFEIEHIDGNKHNNLRENLEVLCPNCHAQTLTWRGRNNRIAR